jgi:hypothetical protein
MHIIEILSTYSVAMSVYVMCKVQKTVETMVKLSPIPTGISERK